MEQEVWELRIKKEEAALGLAKIMLKNTGKQFFNMEADYRSKHLEIIRGFAALSLEKLRALPHQT